MKNYKDFLNEDNDNDEKKIITSDGVEVEEENIIDMIGKIIKGGKDGGKDGVEVGKQYLYKNKDGDEYPVKVLSNDHVLNKTDKTKPFDNNTIDGDDLADDHSFVQVTNTGSDNGKGVIGGPSSNSIAVSTPALKELPEDYQWFKKALIEIITAWKDNKYTEKAKNMLYSYVLAKLNKEINDNAKDVVGKQKIVDDLLLKPEIKAETVLVDYLTNLKANFK